MQTHTNGPSSPIQTITVGSGISPNPAQRLAGYTADRELHPSPKKGNHIYQTPHNKRLIKRSQRDALKM
jgi:hypothetical protein